MTKLPKIYKADISKKITNNKSICYINKNSNNTLEVLDYIFNNNHYPYNIRVKILTNNKEYDTYIISRDSKFIMTLDNDFIRIKDIKNISVI